MDKKLDLTDAEWSVMEQLWAAPGSTGRALTASLEQKTGWSRSGRSGPHLCRLPCDGAWSRMVL